MFVTPIDTMVNLGNNNIYSFMNSDLVIIPEHEYKNYLAVLMTANYDTTDRSTHKMWDVQHIKAVRYCKTSLNTGTSNTHYGSTGYIAAWGARGSYGRMGHKETFTVGDYVLKNNKHVLPRETAVKK